MKIILKDKKLTIDFQGADINLKQPISDDIDDKELTIGILNAKFNLEQGEFNENEAIDHYKMADED